MRDTAVLLLDCPDQRGIVAAVSEFLYRHGANILHADQHQDHDLGLFFMRVEWGIKAGTEGTREQGNKTTPVEPSGAKEFDLSAFERDFAALAAELDMHWTLASSERRPRVALFCSQYLHCMADLLHRWHTGELPCEIPLIVSNHREVEKLAAFYGVPFEHVPVTPATRASAEARQLELLAADRIDLVILARYMQILSPAFVVRYPAAIINVHHSFLPSFSGARPYHRAFERGVKLIGATSHYATAQLDEGPIIEQDVVRVSHRDGLEDLLQKGRDLEKVVLSRAVRWHCEHRVLVYGKKTVIFE